MPQLEDAIKALEELLGAKHVKADRRVTSEYEIATFRTEQRVPVVVFPGSTDEVSGVVKIANAFKLPIYPISKGRNWGLGSRVPVKSGSCVVDLGRMNDIVEFDEDLSYITVRPGVTFGQVSDFLRERSSENYLAMIGGPPDSSLIGNAIERGDAGGPLGEKARFCCGAEVVLPTGEVINCGNEAFRDSLTSKLSKFGLGPDIESLFFQSNLGIITKMTFWLARKPALFQCMIFGIKNEENLTQVVASIRRLSQLGIIKDGSCSIWNVYRVLANQMQYPWDEGGRLKSSPDKVLEHLPSMWRDVRWAGTVGLYSASAAHARADKTMIKKAFKGNVSKLLVVDAFNAKLIRFFATGLSKIIAANVEKTIDMIYYNSIFLGNPKNSECSTMYWRKKMATPSDLDPNRDRCGLHWICVSLPLDGIHLSRLGKIVEEISFKHNLEPQYMFWLPNQWSLKSFIVIAYDRDVEGEDQIAFNCYKDLYSKLYRSGFSPNRLGIQSMASVAPDQQTYIDFIEKIKRLLDPNDILAPGRYDFRHRWRD